MVRKIIRMEVKEVGRKIKYQKSEKAITSMCAVKTEDSDGVEHKAYAWGDLCDNLRVGTTVLATKEFTPKTDDENDRFIIISLEE
ncbi:hypothetical protein [Candidatus Methanoperedens nitratireducens]|uniref:Uncharacterized protein n=1 Tax=Candidatus Methanoperedens nitratireducens TaxID=1392998 RepID=A0A284VSX1_9EURY|nr:hypothetical protein [Candidatus Methanoperedens nitroreducens]SNQ62309.1 hypothetical protein MNV_670015 [Candidatus Methanoperedens nitroreducens]